MKTKLRIAAIAGAILWMAAPSAIAQTSGLRERLSFNADWRFQKDDPPGVEGRLSYERIKPWVITTGNEFAPEGKRPARPVGEPGADVSYAQKAFDDHAWRKLNLPHDWGIEGPFKQEYPGETGKLPWWGVAWYRKHFNVGAREQGKQFYLEIDGAMAYASVWVNGQFVGGWPYGYASFDLNLTPYLEFGRENVIAIRLDNPPDSSRWYPGGGIYRNVWLLTTEPLHVAHWGTYITTPEVAPDAATVNIEAAIENSSTTTTKVIVSAQLFPLSATGQRLAPAAITPPAITKIMAGHVEKVDLRARVRNPRLWSLTTPNRYVVVVTVTKNGKVTDRHETVFGIRTIKFDVASGFFLNGEHVRLNGVCDHHDLGPLGSAINLRALERQIEILKEMGVNAIRTSHNPPAPELLELCDRMGIVVMDEAFDAWRRAKKKNDYHLLFDDWHEKDLRAMIQRDRNHPSVILWSIGNEIGEQRDASGHEIAKALAAIVHSEDPTRPVTAGANVLESGYNGFQKIVDVFGYNYKPAEYGKFRASNPGIPLFASETASTVSSRGEYFFPVSEDKSQGRANFQVSSYDLYAPRWATSPDTEFRGQDEFPFVGGEFVWTGFDYLGEPTPYDRDSTTALNFSDPAEQARMAQQLKDSGKIQVPSRSSYFGIVDLCGFKKDRFYSYQARWRPDFPMAHILPHWNWSERVGEVTPVHVYTSGDEAELFLNGRSLGRKRKGQYEYRLRWDEVKYEPGELRAVAYKKGTRWAEDTVKTTGPAVRVMMKGDRTSLRANAQDLIFVTVMITDKGGLVVPRSNNRINFSIAGPGDIIAVDNGDATNLESFQSKSRSAYNGLCLVVIRSRAGQRGNIRLTAESSNLSTAALSFGSR